LSKKSRIEENAYKKGKKGENGKFLGNAIT
jgi:hypothetical protein